jgi:AraC-like DNA-binding protein
MNPETIKISRITKKMTSNLTEKGFAVCWIQNDNPKLEINKTQYRNIGNSVFFLHPHLEWKILKKDSPISSGYVLYLPKNFLEIPTFKNLHIIQVGLFKSNQIPKINLSPGIEKRIQSILEMLDELISTKLEHREEAILSLLYTFFVYCDGKCNIKSVITDNNAKSALVYKFKKMIDKRITVFHRVGDYAKSLHISDKYLNECVKEVLGVNAKNLIDEQLIMRSRHALKFTDKTIKEICFELGFSSPDYFSSFIKKHTGMSPSRLKKD